MTVDELKKLWDEFYGENMAVEYPAFYKKIKKLEIEKIKENETIQNQKNPKKTIQKKVIFLLIVGIAGNI